MSPTARPGTAPGWVGRLRALAGVARRAPRPAREPAAGDRMCGLVDAGRDAPAGSIVAPVLSGGALIRAARWPVRDAAPGRGPGTVLVCTGRGEFIEKYLPAVADLRGRGFAVVVFDWRGQGMSERALADSSKGHVARFADYDGDVLAVAEQVLRPFCPRPWFGLAHSMGGTVALNVAADHPDLFRRLVVSAPMVEIAGLPLGASTRASTRLCAGAGLSRGFVPGRRERSPLFRSFADNVLTSDEPRYQAMLAYLRAEPGLVLGPPTIGWLHAAFDAMARLQEPGYAERMRTPVLAVVPGFDRVVESRATERLIGRLRASRIVTVPDCRHEILFERDAFREQFWAAFDAFVPGSG